MSVIVTLRIFSGRRNPQWELSPTQIARLGVMVESLARAAAPLGFRIGGLGYHGLQLQPVGEKRDSLRAPLGVYGGAVVSQAFDLGDAERRLERWLLETAADLDPRIRDQILREFDTIYHDPDCGPMAPPPGNLEGRPRYEPDRWNEDPGVLLANNCYNYGGNVRHTDGDSATPGAGGKHPVVIGDCADFSAAVLADRNKRLKALPGGTPDGWPIALFTGPNGDNHFYRQDDSGYWSHKPGVFPVRSCDESGHLIADPRTANTLTYTFCGFFLTGPFARIESG